jgi:hypothetical protein
MTAAFHVLGSPSAADVNELRQDAQEFLPGGDVEAPCVEDERLSIALSADSGTATLTLSSFCKSRIFFGRPTRRSSGTR